MANRRLNQFFYTQHKMPVLVDCNFIVTPTNAAGITSLKGAGVSAVYMDSSTTSSAPVEPTAGHILVKLQDNYKKFLGLDWSIVPPVTGSAINIADSTVMTIGVPYQIVTVGTSTAANWQAAGLPAGLTPAVGMTFLAAITGAGTGTGTVKAIAASGIVAVEPMMYPSNPSISLYPSSPNMGPYIPLRCLGATDATTTTLIATAPVTGSLISLRLYFDDSSVTVGGQ